MTHFLPTNNETETHTSATGISILNILLNIGQVGQGQSCRALSRQLCDFFFERSRQTAGEGAVPSAPLYLISKT